MKEANWNQEIKKSKSVLTIWSMVWTASMALATFGPMFLWKGNDVLSVIAVALNLGLGIGMIWTNIKHVNKLDDLQKKIQVEAMGVALGVGVVGGLSYSLLDIINLIQGDAEISYLVILIGVSYLLGVRIGQKRYK
jgi:hypothetical protein